MTRRRPPSYARKDANHNAICAALRTCGWTVADLANVGAGVPDILIGGTLGPCHPYAGARCNLLVEIKGERGKLNALQVDWHDGWRGQVAVVRTVDEALQLIGQRP